MKMLILVMAVVVIAAVAAVGVIVTLRMRRKRNAGTIPNGPLPGGGGCYIMELDGINCEHCKANAEAALNAFDGIRAVVDIRTQTAQIMYAGYPELELLDRLRKSVEDAGFTVKEIR